MLLPFHTEPMKNKLYISGHKWCKHTLLPLNKPTGTRRGTTYIKINTICHSRICAVMHLFEIFSVSTCKETGPVTFTGSFIHAFHVHCSANCEWSPETVLKIRIITYTCQKQFPCGFRKAGRDATLQNTRRNLHDIFQKLPLELFLEVYKIIDAEKHYFSYWVAW